MAQAKSPEKIVSDLNAELDEVLTDAPVPAKRKAKVPVPATVSTTDAILELAKDASIDADKLQKLIAMKYADEDREARKEYFRHWGEMQADLGAVQKTKTVKDRDGNLLYTFADIDNIVDACGPVIARHGFGWRFSAETLENGEKRTWCIITGYGHEERNYIDLPIMAESKATNALQQRGSSGTYGERYAFKAGFAVVIAGEDNDAVSMDVEAIVDNAPAIAAIQDSKTSDELRENFKHFYSAAQSDDVRILIMAAKDRKKAELAKGAKSGTAN